MFIISLCFRNANSFNRNSLAISLLICKFDEKQQSCYLIIKYLILLPVFLFIFYALLVICILLFTAIFLFWDEVYNKRLNIPQKSNGKSVEIPKN